MRVIGGEAGRTNPDHVSTKNLYFFVTGPAIGSAKVLSMGSTYPDNYHVSGKLMIYSAKRKFGSSFPIGQIDFYPLAGTICSWGPNLSIFLSYSLSREKFLISKIPPSIDYFYD